MKQQPVFKTRRAIGGLHSLGGGKPNSIMKPPVFHRNISVENDPEFVEIGSLGETELPIFRIFSALLPLLQSRFRKPSGIALTGRDDLDLHGLQCQLRESAVSFAL